MQPQLWLEPMDESTTEPQDEELSSDRGLGGRNGAQNAHSSAGLSLQPPAANRRCESLVLLPPSL